MTTMTIQREIILNFFALEKLEWSNQQILYNFSMKYIWFATYLRFQRGKQIE